MNSYDALGFWANLSAIGGFVVTAIGAIVGVYGYCSYRYKWRRKRNALVNYLKVRKMDAGGEKKGQQTAVHLTRYVGLTEDEILKISFESEYIERTVSKSGGGRADRLYFGYKE